MEEKIIIEGKRKFNAFVVILIIIGIILMAIGLYKSYHFYQTGSYIETSYGGGRTTIYYASEKSDYTFTSLLFGEILQFQTKLWYAITFYAGVLFLLLALLYGLKMGRSAITVTDQRVIGKASYGKRVDLPINQISAVSSGAFSSISIATSAGRICIWLLANRDKVFDELSSIIKNYQIQKTDVAKSANQPIHQSSNADELKKFKDLLDSGIITQEEFDAKKKQLLGL